MNIVLHIPKSARYTIGARIENKFLYLLELLHLAYFTEKDKKGQKIIECIFVLDTLKFLSVKVSNFLKLLNYQVLLAKTGETKDKLVVWIPMIARLHPVAAEPDPARTARQGEHARNASGVGNLLHSNSKPFI